MLNIIIARFQTKEQEDLYTELKAKYEEIFNIIKDTPDSLYKARGDILLEEAMFRFIRHIEILPKLEEMNKGKDTFSRHIQKPSDCFLCEKKRRKS